MTTGSLLFDAVITSTTMDGETEDDAALSALTDWLQEQEFETVLYVESDPRFEFYLTLERDGFGHLNANLRGRTVDELLVCLDHLGPGSGFGEWLVQSIGFDYYLDGK